MDTQSFWTPTGEAFGRYLLTTGKSRETKRTYLGSLSIFWEWCARRRHEPFAADRAAIRTWLSERLQTVSSTRAFGDLCALKLFYAWLVDIGERPENPTDGLKVKRARTAPTRPFTVAEMGELLAACIRERDRLIVLTLAHTGMRISELASMRVGDIDWARGMITVRGKGSKDRNLAPSPDLLGRLRSYFGMFADGPIWLSTRGHPLNAHQIRKVIYEIGKSAKLEHVYPHRFRSMFGTEFLENNPDIQALQYLMGHESIETTSKYTEYTRERRALDQMREMNLGGSLSA